MIRVALIALAFSCAPASAATVNDLTMTIEDGRPVFRPADGLDCYTAKFGGMAIDCALVDAALVRPRRAPCWLRPDLVGPCPVAAAVLASLPRPEPVWTIETPRAGGTGGGYTPPRHTPAAVPLPGSGLMLAAALMAGLMMRKRRAK